MSPFYSQTERITCVVKISWAAFCAQVFSPCCKTKINGLFGNQGEGPCLLFEQQRKA